MSQVEDYIVTERALEVLSKLFVNIIETKNNEFANGRFVRNIFESMVMNHARRIVNIVSPTILELQELTENDIPTNF